MVSIGFFNIGISQEWLTSLEVAKRAALIQNKFIFMVWEGAAEIPYPVMMNDLNGKAVLIPDLFDYEEINRVVWDYFIPVIVSEATYAQLYDQMKDTRSYDYMRQLEDDNIKIMDTNFNIVNTSISPEAYFNLSEFLSKYALNTSYLTAELRNYGLQKDFGTAYRLAAKYLDYAIMVHKNVRGDIINLAELYLDDADRFLLTTDADKKLDYEQKSRLLRLEKYLLQNKPAKVLRQLKRLKSEEIIETNQSLLAFLYYTAYQLRTDEKNAETWKAKVSPIDIKKAGLILRMAR